MPFGVIVQVDACGAMLGLLCSGYACRNAFLRAVAESLDEVSPAVEASAASIDAASAGAGDADVAQQHAARVSKVKRWLSRHNTNIELGVLFLSSRCLDALMYVLMGGNRPGAVPHRRPGTTPRVDQQLPPQEVVGQVRNSSERLLLILEGWGTSEADSTALLTGMGVGAEDLRSATTLRLARRIAVGMSAGLFRRFVVRLGAMPMQLWLLTASGADEDLRQSVAQEFATLPACCIGWFGRRLRNMFPSAGELLAPLGVATLQSWLQSLTWSIYSSEKEHSACRRLIASSGPGRNWAVVSRDRFLEAGRVVHVQRTTVDPSFGPAQATASLVDQPLAQVDACNPLLPIVADPARVELDICAINFATDVPIAIQATPAAPLVAAAPPDLPMVAAEEVCNLYGALLSARRSIRYPHVRHRFAFNVTGMIFGVVLVPQSRQRGSEGSGQLGAHRTTTAWWRQISPWALGFVSQGGLPDLQPLLARVFKECQHKAHRAGYVLDELAERAVWMSRLSGARRCA